MNERNLSEFGFTWSMQFKDQPSKPLTEKKGSFLTSYVNVVTGRITVFLPEFICIHSRNK